MAVHTVDWTWHIKCNVAASTFPACVQAVDDTQSKINTDYNISAACAANTNNVCNDINTYGKEEADHYLYTWSYIGPGDVASLKVIKDLMDLVGKRLS